MDLEEIKRLFQIKVLHTAYGQKVVEEGYCSVSLREQHTLDEKDIFYLKMNMINRGKESHLFSFKHFLLSDSDGYFNEPLKSKDYFQSYVKPGESIDGGLLFSLYTDVSPIDLWFNSGHLYEDSLDAILIKVHIDIESESSAALKIHTTHAVNYSRNAENLLKKIIEDHRIPYKKNTKGQYLLRLQCPDYRRQFVYVSFDAKDDQGDELVSIYTICALVPEIGNDRLFLRLNSRFYYGMIAIQEFNGEEYYTVITRQLSSTCDEKELIKGLRSVSRSGDWLEAELNGGTDIR